MKTVRVVRAFIAAMIILAARARAQELIGGGEAQFNVRPVAMFNQHLYYGTFARPRAIAFDREHSEVWIADTGNGLIGIFRADGAELYSFSSKQYLRDPVRLAVAPKGLVAVVEGDRMHVRTFNYRGDYKGDLAMEKLGDKPVIGTIAYDSTGSLYVAENRSGQIFVYTPDGKLKQQFGSRGTDEGQFQSICGIAIARDGTIFVLDQQATAIQVFDDQGNFLRGWGKHEMGAENVSLPSGIVVDDNGHVYITDELRHQVKMFTTDGKFLANFGGLGAGPGQLAFPTDITIDGNGRLYVTERSTARVQVFEVKPLQP